MDEYTRECLALKVDRSLTSEDVIDTLAELFAMRGVPGAIRSDNGPEFVAKAIQRWLKLVDVQALSVEPGSPWQNGYAESFHSRLRESTNVMRRASHHCEAIAMKVALEEFESLSAARRLTQIWRDDYNQTRHTSEIPQPHLHNLWYRNLKLVSTLTHSGVSLAPRGRFEKQPTSPGSAAFLRSSPEHKFREYLA